MLSHLPEHGWEVDVLAAAERIAGDEYDSSQAARRRMDVRARTMARIGALTDPAFTLAGVRPEAFPLSTAWVPRGARDVRRRIASGRYDAILATGPPFAALMAARAGRRRGGPPLVVELRDLWAGNPLFDRRGELLGTLERWVFGRSAAVVAVTPEAAQDVRRRHPALAARVAEIPNGFEGDLLARREAVAPSRPLEILHSGTLTVDRPLGPLLDVLARAPYRGAFRLTLHGYVAPPIAAQLAGIDSRLRVDVVGPSGWDDAIGRIARANATLIVQAPSAGDATAVASKVYEYLALGRPVLALTGGGATEGVLRRVGADRYAARLDDEASIIAALDRLRSEPVPAPVPAERLAPYERATIARSTAALLDAVTSRTL